VTATCDRKSEWIRVSRHRPCPICEKSDWCGISADGEVVCCMRVRSDRPTRNGGWLHRLSAVTMPTRSPEYVPRPRRRPRLDCEAILTRFARDTRPAEIRRLAADLGVSTSSLKRLGIAWAVAYSAWAFPMFDAERRAIGIRLRADDGHKWAVTGSRNGLFWPDGLHSDGLLLISEGSTDTAALLDLGYDAIGRPSCTGAVDLVIEVARRLRRREVVIVADADGPGIDGADRLAEQLTLAHRRPRVIRPLVGKDARAWVRAGATRAVVDTVIANAQHWRP